MIKSAIFLALATAFSVNAEMPAHIENSICMFVVGKIDADVSCQTVAQDVTGLAADWLNEANETRWAQYAKNELVVAAAKFICSEAVTWLKQQGYQSPRQVCAAITKDFRRHSRTTSMTLSDVRTLWNESDTKQWLDHREEVMREKGTPVSVFPDGKVGYCTQSTYDGMYNCMEHGYPTADKYASGTSAGQTVGSSMNSQDLETSKYNTSNNGPSEQGLVAAAVVLGTALVGTVAYAGFLTHRLKTMSSARGRVQQESDGNTLLMSDMN